MSEQQFKAIRSQLASAPTLIRHGNGTIWIRNEDVYGVLEAVEKGTPHIHNWVLSLLGDRYSCTCEASRVEPAFEERERNAALNADKELQKAIRSNRLQRLYSTIAIVIILIIGIVVGILL